MTRGAVIAALALLGAACTPIVTEGPDLAAEAEAAAAAEAARRPGEGLPPRGQPACADPAVAVGIEPPCDAETAAAATTESAAAAAARARLAAGPAAGDGETG